MIYLALHGETVWNREHRFQGRLDSPLTPNGMNQALLIGNRLRRILADPSACVIISSPLKRALRTAESISAVLGIAPERIKTDDRLMEIDLGSWSGLTGTEIEAKWPSVLNGASRYDWYFRSPDGERLDAATSRLAAWLKDSHTANKPIIVVTHGVASRLLRGIYAGIPTPEALVLEISRATVFKLSEGRIDQIRCE